MCHFRTKNEPTVPTTNESIIPGQVHGVDGEGGGVEGLVREPVLEKLQIQIRLVVIVCCGTKAKYVRRNTLKNIKKCEC